MRPGKTKWVLARTQRRRWDLSRNAHRASGWAVTEVRFLAIVPRCRGRAVPTAVTGACWHSFPAGAGTETNSGDELYRRKSLVACHLGKFVSAPPHTPPRRRERMTPARPPAATGASARGCAPRWWQRTTRRFRSGQCGASGLALLRDRAVRERECAQRL